MLHAFPMSDPRERTQIPGHVIVLGLLLVVAGLGYAIYRLVSRL